MGDTEQSCETEDRGRETRNRDVRQYDNMPAHLVYGGGEGVTGLRRGRFVYSGEAHIQRGETHLQNIYFMVEQNC
jgi:hypothetical protein